jgi:hypothetical protein
VRQWFVSSHHGPGSVIVTKQKLFEQETFDGRDSKAT